MTDRIEKIGNSTIHHGKNNDRIYLMSLDRIDLPNITQLLDALARNNGYTKIIAKIPVSCQGIFKENGYKTEAFIPKLYNGEDGCFVCKFFGSDRQNNHFQVQCFDILQTAHQNKRVSAEKKLPDRFECRQLNQDDIPAMANVYQRVFASYPFPIYDKKYLSKTMQENVIYFGIWDENLVVALASIELAIKDSNAEMTDFAVLKEYRGIGFAGYLLGVMEKKLMELSVSTAYTIARAQSPGMNITFTKNGYAYGGTLINNTHISGKIESMNVWYKSIPV